MSLSNKSFSRSTLIDLNFSSQDTPDFCTFANQNFMIACISSKDGQYGEMLLQFLKCSMKAFFQELVPNTPEQLLNSEDWNAEKMGNLVLSCGEFIENFEGQPSPGGTQNSTLQNTQISELSTKNVSGCNFGLCYRIHSYIYILKTPGLEIYGVDGEFTEIKALAGSSQTMHTKRALNAWIKKGNTNLFVQKNMAKIKPEYLIDWKGCSVQPHSQSLKMERIKLGINRQRVKILAGSFETFGFLSPSQTLRFLKSMEKDKKVSLSDKIKMLLQQTRKKMRTIYKQNLYLVSWQV